MTKPEQRVIIYRAGISGADEYTRRRNYGRRYKHNKRVERGDCTPCDRCGRVLKNPERKHYSDVTNKIHCFIFEETV